MLTTTIETLKQNDNNIDILQNDFQNGEMVGANTNPSLSWLSISYSNKKLLVAKINSLQEYSKLPPKDSYANILKRIRDIKGGVDRPC